ncbi:MAG: hypothetical protein J5617_03825 [Bacilli bacterium]|nr:hypothetical protein [Bacilli bacterium]
MGGGQDLTPNEFLRKIKKICSSHNEYCTNRNTNYICPLFNICSESVCVKDLELFKNDRTIDDFVMAVYDAKED